MTCAVDANSCVYQSATTACASTEPCGGAFPNAVCPCPAKPAVCSKAGTFCDASNTRSSPAPSMQAAVSWSPARRPVRSPARERPAPRPAGPARRPRGVHEGGQGLLRRQARHLRDRRQWLSGHAQSASVRRAATCAGACLTPPARAPRSPPPARRAPGTAARRRQQRDHLRDDERLPGRHAEEHRLRGAADLHGARRRPAAPARPSSLSGGRRQLLRRAGEPHLLRFVNGCVQSSTRRAGPGWSATGSVPERQVRLSLGPQLPDGRHLLQENTLVACTSTAPAWRRPTPTAPAPGLVCTKSAGDGQLHLPRCACRLLGAAPGRPAASDTRLLKCTADAHGCLRGNATG